MKYKHYPAFMKAAEAFAELSKCRRLKVGCVIVKDGAIISTGWNGMLPGISDDTCEDCNNTTKPDCIHAEQNAILKLASSTMSGKDSMVFVTHSPCKVCASHLIQVGVRQVVYKEAYRNTEGVDLLINNGVGVMSWDSLKSLV